MVALPGAAALWLRGDAQLAFLQHVLPGVHARASHLRAYHLYRAQPERAKDAANPRCDRNQFALLSQLPGLAKHDGVLHGGFRGPWTNLARPGQQRPSSISRPALLARGV